MHNDILTIGSFTIHGYGLMIAIGIVLAYFLAELRAKKMGLDQSKVFLFVICVVFFGFLGSKILYIITILPEVIADPSIVIRSLGSGWVVYGGILGGILGAIIYTKGRKLPLWGFFDMAMPPVALAQGLGRIGCFLAGCCYGVETDGPLAVVFTDSAFAPNGIPLIPTQLLSAIFDIALFFFLILYEKKWMKGRGQVTAMYLIIYSVGRFIIEFFRGDLIRGSVGTLSTSQFIAIFILAAGIIIFIVRGKKGADELIKKVCIFDLDGTLLYTLESVAAPVNAAIEEYGLEPRPVEEYRYYLGNGFKKAVTRALNKDGVTDVNVIEEVFTKAQERFVKEPNKGVYPYEGLTEVLAKLKQKGCALAVATNKPDAPTKVLIDRYFEKDTFAIVRGADGETPMKPDPTVVKQILEKLGAKEENVLYFGDSNVDMETAKRAGVYAVGVKWGYREEEELLENGADILLDAPADIMTLYASRFEKSN